MQMKGMSKKNIHRKQITEILRVEQVLKQIEDGVVRMYSSV